MFMFKLSLILLQGGSWVFDASDETWKKLMSSVSKWIMMSKTKEVNKPTYIFELCELLAAKNEAFASQVFPKLSKKETGEDLDSQLSKDPMDITMKQEEAAL